jgi:hypothetical protein
MMGLDILTGLPAGFADSTEDGWTSDWAWSVVQKADYTPVCIKAKSATSKLRSSMSYTVMTTGASASGTAQCVVPVFYCTLLTTIASGSINLWDASTGQITPYAFDDIYNDIDTVEFLLNYNTWSG